MTESRVMAGVCLCVWVFAGMLVGSYSTEVLVFELAVERQVPALISDPT